MKHLIKILAFSVIATAAQAQSYSDAVKQNQVCESEGKYTQEAYTKGTVATLTPEKAIKMAQLGELTSGHYEYHQKFFKLVRQKKPVSAHNAYMIGWANCMDELSPR